MKIKTQFTANMVIFGAMLLVIATSAVVTNQKVEKLNEQEEAAKNIAREASELDYLSVDYLLYRESQQRARWESKFQELSGDLSKLNPNTPEQLALVNNIKLNQQRLRAVFTDVASTYENTSQKQALFQISWSRIAVQNRGMAFGAQRLAQTLREQVRKSEQTNIMLIFALLGIFGTYLITNYLIVYRRALKSISDLHAGTEIIGSGNLEYSIKMNRKDEIGDLSNAFDQMTANLKSTTASKAELEKEIAERKRAEGALRSSEQRLHLLSELAREGIVIHDRGTIVEASESLAKMFGYGSASEIIGKSSVGLLTPESQKMLLEKVKTNSEEPYEAVGVKKDGTRFPIEIHPTNIVYKGQKARTGIVYDLAERKKAEQTLRTSEEKYRNLFMSAGDALVTLDLEDRVTSWNPAAERIFGWKTNEVLGNKVQEFLLPPDRAEEREKIRQDALIAKNITKIDTVRLGKDGGRIDVSLTFSPIINPEGKITGLLALVRDISRRKRAEEALRESEKKFSLVFDKAAFAMSLSKLPDGALVDVNEAFVNLFGYERRDLIGKNTLELDINRDKAGRKRIVEELGSRGFVRDMEIKLYKKSGKELTVIENVDVIDFNGENYALSSCQDITLQKNAEQKLKDYTRELEIYAQEAERESAEDDALLSSIGDGVIAINNEKKLVFANQPFLRIFKKSLKGLKDKEFHKAFHSYNKFGNPVPYKQRPMIISLLTGKKVFKNYSDDLGYYAKVGDKLTPLAITASPVILDGKTVGVVGVCRDMTREMEIDRSKNEFLSMAAHQLKTPLTTMSLSLEMILKGFVGKINKDVKRHLSDFFTDVKLMSQLVKDLLNVSRLDMANLEIETKPCNPVALLNDVIKNFEPQIKKKKLKISKRYAAKLPLVNTDEKLTNMSIENIVSNAVNYTPPGGSLALEIGRKDSSVVIKISDSGCGIPEKEKSRVFEKLFRASNVMPKIPGTGLGLYIAKYAVEKCDGKIWFESQEGKGTTFYISLPAHAAHG